MAKDKGGRPTVMNEATVNKLEEVFSLDGTVEEACFYADISRQTYYDYLKRYPEYIDRVDALRQKPVLKARQAVVRGLDSFDNGLKYLERKKKLEFSTRTELTGADGKDIMAIDEEKRTAASKAINEFINKPNGNSNS